MPDAPVVGGLGSFDESDEEFMRFPIMLVFLGVFLMAILITIIAESVHRKKYRSKSRSSVDQ